MSVSVENASFTKSSNRRKKENNVEIKMIAGKKIGAEIVYKKNGVDFEIKTPTI